MRKQEPDSVKESGDVNERETKSEEIPEQKTIQNAETSQVSITGTLLQFRLVEEKNLETGQATKQLVVYILDKESGEVLRRVPPEDFFDPYHKEDLTGFLPLGMFIDTTV